MSEKTLTAEKAMIVAADESRGAAPGRGRLARRRILVVGAGTRRSPEPDPPIGNGRAISVLAAREGADVACADADEGAARATAELVTAEGRRAAVLVADVRDPAACERIVCESIDRLGGLDGVVLNVGFGEGMLLEGTTVEAWDRTFELNVRSHFLVAKAALPRLAPGGAFVFVSSIGSLVAGSRMPAYDSSKSALSGLCRHVAIEGARRAVRANVVAPGLVDTPLRQLSSRGRPSPDRLPVPLGRLGTAWEVAYATVFLLSGESSYVTGQVLVVDGGLTAL